jgi:hypothetical protein
MSQHLVIIHHPDTKHSGYNYFDNYEHNLSTFRSGKDEMTGDMPVNGTWVAGIYNLSMCVSDLCAAEF